MALIVMADFDFGDCDFERKMVEAAGIQFKSFDDARNRTPPRSSSICAGRRGHHLLRALHREVFRLSPS